MELDPASMSTTDRYKILIGAIVPRPIAWVSTISPDGLPNLAPFSFFAGVGSDPMMVLFCPANTPQGGEKDSLRNAKPASEGGVGEFVVNIVPEPLARRMAATAERLPFGESEFALAGLTPAPSRTVRPPRVLESPVSLECVTHSVIRTNPGVPAGGNVVLGRVVHIHAAEGVIDERFRTDFARLDAVGRMGGTGYCRTRDRFEIPSGRAALTTPPPA